MTTTPAQADLLTKLEHERGTLLALLPRFSNEQWRASTRNDGWTVHDIAMHIADSSYGLSLIVLGEVQPNLPLNPDTGWMEVDALNEQRRQKNAGLTREKVMQRVAGSFDHARRAIEHTHDLDAPGPLGSSRTKGDWLERIVSHVEAHRQELEDLIEQ
ncbi:MAG: maleylpyruvate isomerase N-terminal domain-containing protein [Chloroflexota bacterium]